MSIKLYFIETTTYSPSGFQYEHLLNTCVVTDYFCKQDGRVYTG
jgi:hypothetical protein